jgi:subtilisin family serine protease
VVAVLDTGVDVNHHALRGALWVNPREVPGNGVDDDGNGEWSGPCSGVLPGVWLFCLICRNVFVKVFRDSFWKT